MRLIDLIATAIHCHPQDISVEVHDLDHNRYETLHCGMMTKKRIIGGHEEKVFVIRVMKVDRGEREQ